MSLVELFTNPVLTFTVPGDPVGFVSSGTHKWSKRQNKAWEYKKFIETCVGETVKQMCESASKTAPVHVRTVAYFRNGTHPDPENVHKLVKDALFYGCGDKYTGGEYAPPRYDKENPRVEVWLCRMTTPTKS